MKLSANRVAAIATWLAAAGAAVAAAVGALPHNWQASAVVIAALLAKAATAWKYLEGAQRSEALHATTPAPAPADSAPAAAAPVAAAATAAALDALAHYAPEAAGRPDREPR